MAAPAQAMPKRKDPDIPVRQVAVVTPWPGQSAERVEQLVTRKIEQRVAHAETSTRANGAMSTSTRDPRRYLSCFQLRPSRRASRTRGSR